MKLDGISCSTTVKKTVELESQAYVRILERDILAPRDAVDDNIRSRDKGNP